MKVKMLPYKMESQSAKVLAKELGILRLYPNKTYYLNDTLLINWGSSLCNIHGDVKYINHPIFTSYATDKALALGILKANGVPSLEFTYNKDEAQEWLLSGHQVMARKLLTSHSGNGCIYVSGGELPDARMYTKYFNGKYEYRVHVVNNKVIDVAQKKKKNGEGGNFKIRSYNNGWVFCREDIFIPEEVLNVSLFAVKALNLDIAAVDVRYKESTKEVVVLEVNTAPGLVGTTINSYVNAIKELINDY